MDKFGVFRLLTSFYDYYMKNKAKSNDSGGVTDIGNIFKDIPKKETVQNPVPNKTDGKTAPTAKDTAPLKNTLLSAMQNHDRFIERVRKENNIKDR